MVGSKWKKRRKVSPKIEIQELYYPCRKTRLITVRIWIRSPLRNVDVTEVSLSHTRKRHDTSKGAPLSNFDTKCCDFLPAFRAEQINQDFAHL